MTNDKHYRKVAFLAYSILKGLILGLKAVKRIQTENQWVLGSHPRDDGHVLSRPTTLSLKY